jgi:PadR family transcriptional regulator, regulatory protein PadR
MEIEDTEVMKGLTAFQRDLLYVCGGLDKPHGLAVRDELEEYYSDPIKSTRIYSNLNKLVDEGLVKKGQHDRRTNFYTLTDKGRHEVEAYCKWEAQYVTFNI